MMASTAEEDRRLVARAQGGDFAAFEALVLKYERRLFYLALRILRRQHDAEEVVQQTFVSVIEHIEEFRGQSAFYTWLARIATNHARALLRRESVRRARPLAEDRHAETYDDVPHPEYIAPWRQTPEEIASRRETRELLMKAREELDEKHRLVVSLREVEGLSTAETAESLGISQANVKVRLLRARLQLRERLTRHFGDEATRVAPDHRHRSGA